MRVKLILCNSTKWYKWVGNELLKWADNSNSGHFAIELSSYSTPIIYESVLPKSKKSKISKWLQHYEITEELEIEVPPEYQGSVYFFLESLLNKPYAIDQIFFIGLCLLFHPLDKAFNWGVLNHEKALICTEYGSRFLEKFIQIEIKESHDKIGLNDMKKYMNYLRANGIKWKPLND
jgi:hypothetical protein